jgi:excisionase family DNA binding protein
MNELQVAMEVYRMTNEPEKWSSLEEIAEHLGVSKDTIRNWIRKGVIPHKRVGKQFKFRISEVDKWVESGESANID